MASVDRIQHQLGVATTEYRRCVEELKEKGEKLGEKEVELHDLKKNLRQRKYKDENEKNWWIEDMQELEKQKEKLEEVKKKLEIEKDEWKEELRKWAEKLRAAIDDTEHLAKRARIDMPDNTLSFLQLLCPPFDEPITRSNLEHYEWFNLPEEQLSIMEA
ncbi:hypothetical protein G9A89_004166 [Geosiphon pyriformis]|nr:hypothetical protein G9A89_004166 [Geosiphon pyriformis]